MPIPKPARARSPSASPGPGGRSKSPSLAQLKRTFSLYDVNGDGEVSASDALMIINRLGQEPSGNTGSPRGTMTSTLAQIDLEADETDDDDEDLMNLLANDIAGIWSKGPSSAEKRVRSAL